MIPIQGGGGGSIRIIFHNMGGLRNALTEPIRNNLDTLKKILHNWGVYILVLAELKINWRKVTMEGNIYHWMDGWYKTRRVNIEHNKTMVGDWPFQSRSTSTIAMNKITCRVLNSRNNPRYFVRWSSILFLGKKIFAHIFWPPTAPL